MAPRKILSFFLMMVMVHCVSAQESLKQGLNVPASFTFQSKNYGLAWSSHPTTTYFKYEYLPKGDSLRNYSSMIMLEYVSEGTTAAGALANKIEELKHMKKGDSNVEYFSSMNAAGEQQLDFVLTARGPGGKVSIAERNIYRYIKSGNGLILFGISVRKYGDHAVGYLKNWKADRSTLISEFSKITPPKLSKL